MTQAGAKPLTLTRGLAHREAQKDLLARPLIAGVLLACLSFLVYLPVMGFDLVAYDDFDYVTSNLEVQHGLTWGGIKWAFVTGHSSNWHPLTWLSLMADVQLFGGSAGAMHLTNLFLHAANA